MSQTQDRDSEPVLPSSEDDSASQGDPAGAPDLADLIDGPPDGSSKDVTGQGNSGKSDADQGVEQAQEYGSGGQDAGSME